MRGGEFLHFETAIVFIERFKQSESVSTLTRHILEAASAFGYRNFSIIAGPHLARTEFEPRIMLMHWPDDWLRQYVHENFQDHDPVVHHARNQAHSFYWTQAPFEEAERPKGLRVMDTAAHDYNMAQGLCVPIYGMHGYEGSVNFGGPDIDSSLSARSAMELVAMYAVNSLARLRTDNAEATVLSMREKEVLTWAAVGKTAWDTGRILQISTDTVNKHIASAMRKLDSFSKTQAVAESLRRGEIEI